MVGGLENIAGLGFLKNISGSSIWGGIAPLIQIFFSMLFIAVIVGAYYYFKSAKNTYNKKIHLFEEINGQFVPIDDDLAMEITIPNTSVKVFFLKKNKIFLPRPTIPMGKNRYWYGIRRNREWVNFRLKDLNQEMREANLDYDHTDMRYANTSLKRLIKENYDSSKWWEKHADKIALGAIILLVAFSFWFVLGRVGDLITQLNPILERSTEACGVALEVLSKLDNICSGSGIVRVG